MARSPEYVVPEDRRGQGLAGVRSCGCVTAALSVTKHPGYPGTTEKDVRDFYADMGRTGRDVRWLPVDEIRAKLFNVCAACEARRAA